MIDTLRLISILHIFLLSGWQFIGKIVQVYVLRFHNDALMNGKHTTVFFSHMFVLCIFLLYSD